MPTPSENPANPQNTPDVVVEAFLGAETGNPPVVSEDGTTHPASEPPIAPEGEIPDGAVPPPQP